MYLLRPDSQTHFQSIWLRHPYVKLRRGEARARGDANKCCGHVTPRRLISKSSFFGHSPWLMIDRC